MRIHHKIVVLTGLVLVINLSFQVYWLVEFAGVKQAVDDYQYNWLPSVSLAAGLALRLDEFRRLELAYLLSRTPAEMAGMARAFDRQKQSLVRAEYGLSWYVRSAAEAQALEAYRQAKGRYLARHALILKAMAEGDQQAAREELVGQSREQYQTMNQALDTLQLLNKGLADQAGSQAALRFADVLSGMGLALAANLLVGAGAVWLTARRISKPIADLVTCMQVDGEGVPACKALPHPGGAPREVLTLYQAYETLTAKLASTMERLETQAVTDALTGLANRRRMAEGGQRILEICRRGGLPCSVLMADIDHFKDINDTFGHQAGDAVLAAVAGVLAQGVRASDLCARYGGEEFVVVAPSAGADQARQQAERLRQAVSAMAVDFEGQAIRCTISVGYTTAQGAAMRLDAMLSQADEAMYRAKQGGRNRVEGGVASPEGASL